MYRRVALIGGGAASAALLQALVERAATQPATLHLDWYADTDQPGRGVAYGIDSPRLLLNVRAASMGMFSGKPQAFLDFARERDPGIAGTDFLPRRLYGDYLQAELARALALAPARGIDVRLRPLPAAAVVPEADGVTVLCGDEQTHADAALLALGTLPPRPLPFVAAEALAQGRYVVDPWAFLARPASGHPPPRRVLVLGLGLTAVDVILELAARWPQTQFIALSRHGHLPEAHRAQAAAPVDDGGALFEALHEAPQVRRWMRQLREAVAASGDWRAVIDGLRPHLQTLWQALPPEERARFLRHARWAWERVRHRMPPQVAEAVAALEGEGRLECLRGRVRAVTTAGDALRVQLSAPAENLRTLEGDLVIQATGLNTDLRQDIGHPLLRQMALNGHLLPDPLGLGVQAEADGRLRHAGGTWPQIYTIGGLLRGTLWESTAMPEIRQHARALAERILAG